MTFPLHERDGRLIKGTSWLVAHKPFSIPWALRILEKTYRCEKISLQNIDKHYPGRARQNS